MNSKLLLIIAAVAIIGGGVFAVRNLTTSSDETARVEVEEPGVEDTDPSVTAPAVDRSGAKVSGINNSGSRNTRPTPGRNFNRGEGAAAIDVTPATTTTAQAIAAAAGTPVTTTTELAGDDAKAIADLAARFLQETDPEARIDIADELGLIDDPAAIAKMIELLRQEQDPTVQAALLEGMQGLDALEATAPEVLQAVKDIYARSTDPDVRIAAQDLLGDVATADAVATLREMHSNAQADPLERLNAAENLMRIRAIDPDLVSPQEVAALNEQLKLDYQAGPDASFRSQAIMAMAIDGRNNLPFFQQALQTEQDPQLKTLLERLVRMFSATPPATPPPGATITPAPTPLVVQ